MKVTFLSPYYYPHIGGVETHVKEISSVLHRQGHQITVVTQQHDPSLPLEEKIDGIKVLRIPLGKDQYLPKFSHKVKVWTWVLRNKKTFLDADIVHAHDVVWWLLPLAPLLTSKLYTTFHGWEGQYPVRWQAKLQRLAYSWLSQKTIHIGYWIREFYWDKPDIVLEGGIKL